MTSIEFLKNELQIIAEKFPNVHIKYGYNDIIETHIVELLPLIEYMNNKELDNTWIPVSLKFMETFKYEEVAFISSDSTLSLSKVIFEFNSSICTEENIITEIFAPLTENIVSYSFPTEIPNSKILESNIFNVLKSPIADLEDNKYVETSYAIAA